MNHFNIIPSPVTLAYKTFQNYNKDYPEYKTKPIVDELKKQLTDDKLKPEQRSDVAERIAFIEHTGKSNRQKLDLILLVTSIVNYITSFFGSIASGIVKICTSNLEQVTKKEIKAKIIKCDTPALRRQAKAQKKSRGKVGSPWPGLNSVVAYTKAFFVKLVTKPFIPNVKNIIYNSISYMRFFLPFSR